MCSFEATAKIRHLESDLPRTPIVAVTANSSICDWDACISAGMDDYVRKPARQADLKTMLERWVGSESAQ